MDNRTPDPQRQEKARQYARLERRLMLVNLAISGTYALLWLALGWSSRLSLALKALTPYPAVHVALFLIVFGGALYVINLPLSWYQTYTLPHRFELSTQTRRGWVMDQAKGLAVGGVIGVVIIEVIYLVLRHFPQTWWIGAAAFLLTFNVLLAYLAPVVLYPLFNKFTPLSEEYAELVERLKRLGENAGAHIGGVYKMDMSRRTKAANAALTGLGRTRRIILGDTLLNEFTPQEIETVLAHELGHHVHKDLALLMSVSALATVLGLAAVSVALNWGVQRLSLGSVSDVAAMPLLVLALGAYQLLLMPIVNAVTRWRERLADQFALEITGDGAAYASALVRLADQNLAEVDPEPWVEFLLYSHPPLSKRIAMAQSYPPKPV
jgi:STE24 endopeptidase